MGAVQGWFIVLTAFLVPLAVTATYTQVKEDAVVYYVSLGVLETLLLNVFLCDDLVVFYTAFELVLVPLFVLLGVFGGVSRYRASFLLFLYTLGGSLFMLAAFSALLVSCGTTSILAMKVGGTNLGGYSGELQVGGGEVNVGGGEVLVGGLGGEVLVGGLGGEVLGGGLGGELLGGGGWFWENHPGGEVGDAVFLALVFSLVVKTPLVPFHVWLPRAHAEANLAGSMLLAGVVLKLATYGYLQLVLPLMGGQVAYYSHVLVTVCLVSMVGSSLSAIRLTDVKGLVAVSSVAHMSVVVIGLFSCELEGVVGGVVLSLAHGLVSPLAFYCVGGVLYTRYHTRQLAYYSGLSVVSPLFTAFLFLALCGNMGVPLSLNFVGELLSLAGVYLATPVGGWLAGSSILLSACYSLYLYNRVACGSYSVSLGYAPDLTRLELHVVAPLVGLTVLFGLSPTPLLQSLAYDVTLLL